MATVTFIDSIPRIMAEFPSPPNEARDNATAKILSMYANRPLPAIPPRSSRRESKRRSMSTSQIDFKVPTPPTPPIPARASFAPGHARSVSSASTSPSTKSLNRFSTLSRSNSDRRSSRKIQQLTGHDVGFVDDISIESGSIYTLHSACSSDSDLLASSLPDEGLLPLLEEDEEGTSTRESSWGPTPPSPVMPAPLNIQRNTKISTPPRSFGFEDSFALESTVLRPWEPGYGQFTDRKASGQYHRIAVELASPRIGDSVASTKPSQLAQKRDDDPTKYRFSGTAAFSKLCDSLLASDDNFGQLSISYSAEVAEEAVADDDKSHNSQRDTLDIFTKPIPFRPASRQRPERPERPSSDALHRALLAANHMIPSKSLDEIRPMAKTPSNSSKSSKGEGKKGVAFNLEPITSPERPKTSAGSHEQLQSAFDSDSESEYERPMSSGNGRRHWWARRSDWDLNSSVQDSSNNLARGSNLRHVRSLTDTTGQHRRVESAERLSVLSRRTDHVKELFSRRRLSPTAVKAEKRRSDMRRSIRFMPGPTLV